MSEITQFSDTDAAHALVRTTDRAEICRILSGIGVRFEQWQANKQVVAGDSQDAIIDAYRDDIDKLVNDEGYQSVDVVSLTADHPDKAALRQKFLTEHTHGEDEVRFFVDGHGLFSLHVDNHVFEVLCEKGDLISVPALTKHWFDMGPNPHFVAIRLFNNPDGWIAKFTKSNIADRYSRLDN